MKKTEQELRKSNEQYRTLVSTSPDGILQVDLDFNIFMVNKHVCHYIGFENEADLIGLNALDFILAKDKEKLPKVKEEALETGYYSNLEFTVVKDGVIRGPVEANISVVYDEKKNPTSLIIIIRDIRERKEMQEKLREYTNKLEKMVKEKAVQLMQQERVAMLGRLAGSISHNINNPLHYVRGTAELLNKMLDDPYIDRKVLKELTQTLIDGCNRIAEVSDRLRRVSRKDNISIFDIAVPLEVAVTVTRGRWRSKCSQIKVRYLTNKIIKVKGIEADIAHVFMNLIVNSAQAIEEKGSIEIRVSEINNGSNVLIEIEDDGSGIPPEIADKIGKESITTKPPEEGTGLGLMWVYDVIQQHYGSISFKSEPGKGTIFRIKLPICKNHDNKTSGRKG
ncbi:MAG: two-component system sensor histidine kinase NtrB [Candidatus Heimdallarchaeaceae archaeon]